jgi:hypothetical protein
MWVCMYPFHIVCCVQVCWPTFRFNRELLQEGCVSVGFKGVLWEFLYCFALKMFFVDSVLGLLCSTSARRVSVCVFRARPWSCWCASPGGGQMALILRFDIPEAQMSIWAAAIGLPSCWSLDFEPSPSIEPSRFPPLNMDPHHERST